MILKKPFAFLIKHFRLIHLILALPMIYLLLKTKGVVDFFSAYVNAGYITETINLAGSHIDLWMYLITLIIILIVFAIYLLMRQKKKNTLYYNIILVFYIIFFIVLGFTYAFLGRIETGGIEAKTIRAFNDISFIGYFPQYLFCAFVLIRGVGFNIRKLKFDNAIVKELEINAEDSEEFEFNITVDNYKYQRSFRRLIREFTYYFKENKFIIICVFIIVSSILGTFLYLNFGVYNKKYTQQQVMSYSGLSLSVETSFITNMNYNGKVITDKYYMVAVLHIENLSSATRTLDLNLLYLNNGTTMKQPILDKANNFIDYGLPYTNTTEFRSGSKANYVFVYEIEKEDINNNYSLKILESIRTSTAGDLTPNYKIINLKPDKYLEINDIDYRTGKIILLDDTALDLSEIRINSFEILNSYTYEYEYCYTSTNCKTLTDKVVPDLSTNIKNQTLLILDAKYSVDQTTYYYKNRKSTSSFIGDFITINYESLGNTKEIQAVNITPKTLKGKIIIQIPTEVANSQNLKIYLTTRNNRYITRLK